MNFVITYGISGKTVGHDYDGGYTFVHAPNYEAAVNLWKAIHHRTDDYPLKCAFIYNENDLKRLGKDMEDFGVCHDTIVYQDRETNND